MDHPFVNPRMFTREPGFEEREVDPGVIQMVDAERRLEQPLLEKVEEEDYVLEFM